MSAGIARCRKHPRKLRWTTQADAQRQADLKLTALGVPFRAYLCDVRLGGCGWYHLTTAPLRPGTGEA